MVEIHGEDGKLIATIHDTAAFSQLLDNFERLLHDYSPLKSPLKNLIPHLIYRVDQNTIDFAVDAANRLRELRKQFGDSRDDLYPTDIPTQYE
jgi:hypothetical protein